MPLVLLEKKDRIAYITLNLPEKRNVLTSALVDELPRRNLREIKHGENNHLLDV